MNKKIIEMENIIEKIDNIYKLNDELSEAMENESEAIKSFVDKDKKRTIKRKNSKGDQVSTEISNKEIMEEIRITKTLNGEAGELLKEENEDTYNKLLATAQKNEELHDYVQKTFGFSFRNMGIADYLKLTEAVIKYNNEQKTK